MARQDFLSGGYIGKLGMTVGQRWHNKRFIRTWVQTPQAGTPTQVQNQVAFGVASKMANAAMQSTGHFGWYNTTEIGEFAQRSAEARKIVVNGKTLDEVALIYPATPGISVSMSLDDGSLVPGQPLWGNWELDAAVPIPNYNALLTFVLDRRILWASYQATINRTASMVYITWPPCNLSFTTGQWMMFFVGAYGPGSPRPVPYSTFDFNDEI